MEKKYKDRPLEIELLTDDFISLRFDYDENYDNWVCILETEQLDRYEKQIDKWDKIIKLSKNDN